MSFYHILEREVCPSGKFATPWTAAHQAPLSMGFPRQEYQSRLPFPSLDLLDLGIEPTSLVSCELAGRSIPPHHVGGPPPSVQHPKILFLPSLLSYVTLPIFKNLLNNLVNILLIPPQELLNTH